MGAEEINNKIERIFYGVHTREEKESLGTLESIDIKKNWGELQNRIHRGKRNYWNVRVTLPSYFTKIAAAILFIIISSVTIYTIKYNNPGSIREISSRYENTEVLLDDASKIILKKGSALLYPKKFNRRKREVRLSGEAWFEISRAEKKPFFVYMENSTIRVLGTSFNIKEESTGDVTVSVVSGSVSFYENKNHKNVVTLEAGQQAVFNRSTNKFETLDCKNKNFSYWRTGRLEFKNSPLEEVFMVLEENYNVSIIVGDKSLTENQWTTTCENQSLEEILYELGQLFGLEYNIVDDTVSVFKNKETDF